MYGGNDKSIDEVIEEVKETVVGQDGAVEWLASFADAACERSRIIHERGVSPLSLPNIGSAMMVGPTASGKSHLVKTFAKTAGLLFHPIDAGQMSAEGYIGNSFSVQWKQISDELAANPGKIMLVFVDEADKLFGQRNEERTREGWAGYDLLKPLEGGTLTGTSPKGDHTWSLDCDRCVFVIAGAFTGIEKIVARRLGGAGHSVGFTSSEATAVRGLSEDELRDRVALDDLEGWGVPRELVGRISTVRFLKPLGEEALHEIVRRNKQAEYGSMLPGEGRFVIDRSAEDLLVKQALGEHYGARFINQQINGLFCGEAWRAVRAAGNVASLTLTVRDGGLGFEVEKGEGSPAEAAGSRTPAAYGLLSDVHHMLSEGKGASRLDPCADLGRGCCDYAAALLCQGGGASMDESGLHIREDYSPAEIVLLYALYTLLHDWFPRLDQTPDGLISLFRLTEPDDGSMSPLDLLFHQIRSGLKYARDPDWDPADSLEHQWAWVRSNFRRNTDGARPADTGGLRPDEDRSLGYYTEFRGYPRDVRRQAVRSLAFRMLQAQPDVDGEV